MYNPVHSFSLFIINRLLLHVFRALGIEVSIPGDMPQALNVLEGSPVSISVIATGFSYGNIPISVTPLACSDYQGNLGDLFSNVPVSSANPGINWQCCCCHNYVNL